MFKRVIFPVIVAFLLGLVVSLATGAILTPDEAVVPPGGSLSIGLMTGFFWTYPHRRRVKVFLVLATACAGLLGWVTHYCLFI